MARSIGAAVPESLWEVLDGSNTGRWMGTTMLLLTTTAEGWPHLAMLSVGEVLLRDAGRIALALWPTSTATTNLTREGRATLALVYAGAGYSVRATSRRAEDLAVPDAGTYACFDLAVADVQEDVAPYAVLTAGVTYELKEPAAVLARWERTIHALRVRFG